MCGALLHIKCSGGCLSKVGFGGLGKETTPCLQAERIRELPLKSHCNDPSADPCVQTERAIEAQANRHFAGGK
jgi:hypothetical protein